MSKKITIISIVAIVIFAFIGGGVFWYFKQSNKPVNPLVTENELEQKASSTENVDMSDWITFSTIENTSMKFRMSFKYPNSWVQKGSIDGGSISSVPFFDKEKYLEDCNKNNSIGEQCLIKGQIAYLYVNNNDEDINTINKEENKHEVIINGYKGILRINDSQLGIKNMEYIGNSKIELTLPNINGHFVKFIMVLQTELDRFLFDKILETIKF